MTTKRTGTPWMTPAEYGRTLTGLSMNLIVRDVARSLPFYRDEDPDGYAFAVGIARG